MNEQLYLERRSSERKETDTKCWIEGESLTLLGKVINVSAGGCFVRIPVPVEGGSEIALKVTAGEETIAIKGKVAWSAPNGWKPEKFGIGVGFEDSKAGVRLANHLNIQKEYKVR